MFLYVKNDNIVALRDKPWAQMKYHVYGLFILSPCTLPTSKLSLTCFLVFDINCDTVRLGDDFWIDPILKLKHKIFLSHSRVYKEVWKAFVTYGREEMSADVFR